MIYVQLTKADLHMSHLIKNQIDGLIMVCCLLDTYIKNWKLVFQISFHRLVIMTLLGNYWQFVCHLFVCLSPVCFSRPWPTKYMYKWNCMNKYIQKTMSRPTKFSTCQNLAKYVKLKRWVGAKKYVYWTYTSIKAK